MTYLALIIVRDVGDYDCCLVGELRCAVLQRFLVFANEEDVRALIQIPKREGLSNTGGSTSDHDTLVHEVVHVFRTLFASYAKGLPNSGCNALFPWRTDVHLLLLLAGGR